MCSGNTKVLKLKMADFMLFFKHSRFVTDSDGSRKKVQNLEIHVIGTYYLVCGNMSTLNIDPEMLKLDIIRLSKGNETGASQICSWYVEARFPF